MSSEQKLQKFVLDRGKKRNGDHGGASEKVDLGKRKTKRQAATKASKKVRFSSSSN